jgi:predicted nucleic acid-binding protein
MIFFDANIFITLATEKDSSVLYERLEGLIQDLVKSKTAIGVPAPAWAEVLCGTDIATSGIISLMRKRSAIRILPFDEASAFEAAFIHRGAINTGKKKGHSKAPWQQIKVDRQILAIARQHGVKIIYTDDDNMIAEATRLGIDAIRSTEIPLKTKQINIDFANEVEEDQGAMALPSPGSDPGEKHQAENKPHPPAALPTDD